MDSGTTPSTETHFDDFGISLKLQLLKSGNNFIWMFVQL